MQEPSCQSGLSGKHPMLLPSATRPLRKEDTVEKQSCRQNKPTSFRVVEGVSPNKSTIAVAVGDRGSHPCLGLFVTSAMDTPMAQHTGAGCQAGNYYQWASVPSHLMPQVHFHPVGLGSHVSFRVSLAERMQAPSGSLISLPSPTLPHILWCICSPSCPQN